jgi:hypothetical protein
VYQKIQMMASGVFGCPYIPTAHPPTSR